MHSLLMVKLIFVSLLALLIYSAFAAPSFWKSVFSDGGTGSLSRVMTAFNGAFALAWVTMIVFKKMELPTTDLLTLAAFVNAPYGINVAGKIGNTAAGSPSRPNQTVVADQATVTQVQP